MSVWQHRQRFRRGIHNLRALVTILAAFGLLAGCGGSAVDDSISSFAAAPPSHQLVGRVFDGVTDRLEGAPVVLFTGPNQEVARSSVAAGGYFVLPNAPITSPLTVEVEIDQQTHYRAEVENSDFLSVNSATTLAAAYHDLHPELTVGQCHDKVSAYLGLPAGAELGGHATNPAYGFDHFVFADAAEKHGEFDAFVALQASAIDGGPTLNQGLDSPFAPSPESGFSLSSAGLSVLSGLGKGALSYLGGAAFSWVLSEAGIPIGNTATLEDIEDQLSEISSQLTQIESDLSDILNAIYASLSTVLSQSVQNTINSTQSATTQLLQLSGRPDATDAEVALLVNAILTEHSTMLLDIGSAQLGAAGNPGLIQLTLRNVGANGRFINSDNKAALERELSYYQTAQLQAANLLLEACHASNPLRLVDSEGFIDQFYISCKQQQHALPQRTVFPEEPRLLGGSSAVVPVPVPTPDRNVMIDTKTGLMWMRALQGEANFNTVNQLLKGNYFQVGYRGWRLPTVAEVQALGAGASYLSTQAGLQGITSTTTVFTSELTSNTSSRSDLIGRTTFTTNFVRLVTLDNGVPGTTLLSTVNSSTLYGTQTQTFDNRYPFLLVRDLKAQPQALTLSSVSAEPGALQFTCRQPFSEGQSSEDVTERVIWSVAVNGQSNYGQTFSKVHISNAPDSSGLLTVRAGLLSTDRVSVTAQLGTSVVSQDVTTLPATDNTTDSLIISPTKKSVLAVNPAPFQLTATAVSNSGSLANVTNQVTWTTDPPNLITVSPLGVATIVLPLPVNPQPTLVTITGTYQGVSGASRVVLP